MTSISLFCVQTSLSIVTSLYLNSPCCIKFENHAFILQCHANGNREMRGSTHTRISNSVRADLLICDASTRKWLQKQSSYSSPHNKTEQTTPAHGIRCILPPTDGSSDRLNLVAVWRRRCCGEFQLRNDKSYSSTFQDNFSNWVAIGDLMKLSSVV